MQHNTFKGVACVLFSILVWSGWMVVSRLAVKGTLTPYDITALRFMTSGLILLPFAIRNGLKAGPWGYASSFILSLLIGALYTMLAVSGMQFAPASHASVLINGTLLVVTTILGFHGLRETTSKLRLTGVFFSVVGIVCMLVARNAASAPHQWFGHILFVISGAIWGVYTILVRKWNVSPLQAATVVCVFSMFTYMPIYLLFLHPGIGMNNWQEALFQLLYQGVLTAILAFITFNISVHILGASHAGAFIPLVPVLSTLLAIPVLHEIPTLLEWSGVATVSFGVFLSSGALNWRPASFFKGKK